MNDRVVHLKVACLNLRHKAMYSYESHDVRGMVDETIDTIPFFCLVTCDSLGPDNESAGPAECRPGRACYKSAEPPPDHPAPEEPKQ